LGYETQRGMHDFLHDSLVKDIHILKDEIWPRMDLSPTCNALCRFHIEGMVLKTAKDKYTLKSYLQWYSVCDLQKYFSHPSSVIYFLPAPATKLGLQIGVRVLTVIHSDQSISLPNQQQVLGFACALC
jgi:hypothetical protein